MKKIGFVDIIIILLVVALLAVGYKIVSDKEGTSSAAISDVEFTVELSKLDKKYYCVTQFRLINSPDAPFIIAVEKYDK